MYLSMNTFEYKSRSSNYVTDTMGLVLRMEQRKMGARAKFIFESAEADKTIIHIPSFVFAEMLYLYEKRRISVSPNDIATYLATYPNYKEAPLDFAIIQAAAKINDIRERDDRQDKKGTVSRKQRAMKRSVALVIISATTKITRIAYCVLRIAYCVLRKAYWAMYNI